MHASFSEDTVHFETSIEYVFKKKSLLKEALTHKSFAHERQENTCPYNERLEFLGDAVLALIISEYLFGTYPEYTESDLSKVRAYIVQEATLAEAAQRLGIGAHLRLGRGEEQTGGRRKPSLLANAFEAILGAVYIDGGIKKAKDFALRNLKNKIDKLVTTNLLFDYKTKLQEVAQAEFGVLPRYVIHKEEGPEHRKTFEVEVFIKNNLFGTGRGRSKKAAAQMAAKAGLEKVNSTKK